VKTVVFDKTGTLTIGKPAVVSAVLFSSYSMEEFCDLAMAAEVCLSIVVKCLKMRVGILSTYMLKW